MINQFLITLLVLGQVLIGCPASAQVVSGTQTPGFFSTTNYVMNPGAEKNLANVTASTTGILTRTTSSPLEGKASFQLHATAASQTFTWAMNSFDNYLSGQNCEARFVMSGDGSLYTAAVYQGASPITPTTYTLPFLASGSQTISLSYPCGNLGSATTLVITSTASAAAFLVDRVYSGLSTSLTTAGIVTDEVSYVPTIVGFGTVTGLVAFSRRVGSKLEAWGSFLSGTSTATAATISLGYNGVNSNVSPVNDGGAVLGSWQSNGGAVGSGGFYNASGVIGFTGSASTSQYEAINGSDVSTTGAIVAFRFSIPIQGWSGTFQSAYLPSAGGLAAGDVVPTFASSCPLGTIATDGSTYAVTTYPALFAAIGYSYGGSGSNFIVPNTGGIYFKGVGSSSIGGVSYSGALHSGGVDTFQGHQHSIYDPGHVHQEYGSGSGTVGGSYVGGPSPANQALSSFTASAFTGILATNPVTDGANGTPRTGLVTEPGNLTIMYCIRTIAASPAPIIIDKQASSMRYTGTSSSLTSTQAKVTFSTVDYDVDGAYSSGVFTVPAGKGGKFQINSNILAQCTYVVNNQANLFALHNGSAVAQQAVYAPSAVAGLTVFYSDTLSLAAGDTFEIDASANGTGCTINTGVAWLSIVRVSN